MLTIFQIEVTSRCNMACHFCPHSCMKRKKEDMDLGTFHRCLHNLVPGQKVGLHMVGEPLLHPHLFYFIDMVGQMGALPEINTNGLLLDTETLGKIANSRLNAITMDVTMDKERPEIMDKVLRKARDLMTLATSAAVSGSFPLVRFQCVTHDQSEITNALLRDFILEVSHSEGCVFVRKFLDTWAGSVEWSCERTNVATPKERRMCPEPWNRVSILQNGDVVPCCRDAEGQTVYGNINDQTLGEIEDTSKVLRDLRMTMIRKHWDKLPEPCKSCREWHIPMNRDVSEA